MADLLEVVPLVDVKIVKETLSRMGILSEKKHVLWPSCYLVERDGKFNLVHFKEGFGLVKSDSFDGMDEKDVERRNSIAFCLSSWGLVKVVNPEAMEPHDVFISVLPHKHEGWTIEHKIRLK